MWKFRLTVIFVWFDKIWFQLQNMKTIVENKQLIIALNGVNLPPVTSPFSKKKKRLHIKLA